MSGEIAGNKEKTYYMAIALLSERRSKDPERQVGACIVNEKEGRVVGIGYNGMPINCRDDLMPWSEKNDKKEKLKHLYVTHAEMNAVVNMTPQSVAGCAIYVTLHPCNECAKILVRSGITKVVYLSFDECYQRKDEFQLSVGLLTQLKEEKKIEYEKFWFNGKREETIRELTFDGLCHSSEWLSRCQGYNSGEKFIRKKIEKLKKKEKSHRVELQRCVSRSQELEDILKPISWEQYFMGMAITARDMMSDSRLLDKEGACIANEDNRIVGLGFLQLQYEDRKKGSARRRLVLHAPVCAIVNEDPVSVRNCTLYVTRFPCNECAKVIVQSGIKAVVYLDHPDLRMANERPSSRRATRQTAATGHNLERDCASATKRMFNLAKVRCVSYRDCYEKSSVILDFAESNLS